MSKKGKKVVMFDVDGVLADFVCGYTTLANEMFPELGIPIIYHVDQPDWSFSTIMTSRTQDLVWNRIRHSHAFWLMLAPLVDEAVFARINKLSWSGHTLYFVTNRPGGVAPSPQRQTWLWLKQQGISTPNVIISSKKGDIAAAVRATHSIEDKIENAWCIHWISPRTKSYLINRPYNQLPDAPKIGTYEVHRVDTIGKFLEEIEDES